jgi:hypothetical protein
MSESTNEQMTAEQYRQQQAAGTSEEEIHRAVVQWANLHTGEYPELHLLFHPANGGARPYGSAGKMKAKGVRAGVPDLLLPANQMVRTPDDPVLQFVRVVGLALELKSMSGRLRPSQKWWLYRLRENGWAVDVAYSFEGATNVLESYLSGVWTPSDLDLSGRERPS